MRGDRRRTGRGGESVVRRLRFVLCADDYGMTEGVSRGVLEAAVAGRISAASAMTSLPDWPRAAAAWRSAAPPADLGLHVNLTVGAPLGAAPALAPGGVFAPLPRLLARAAARPPLAEIEAEIGRQIDAFVAAFGAPPSHIDGHQHVHGLPGVRAALFAALAARGVTGVNVRACGDRTARIVQRRAMAFKAAQVGGLTAGFGRAARRAGLATNDGFAGFSHFAAGQYAGLFPTYLRAPGPRHLVMCHPGYVDAALTRLDPVTHTREEELRFLLSSAFTAALTERNAVLVRHRVWLNPP